MSSKYQDSKKKSHSVNVIMIKTRDRMYYVIQDVLCMGDRYISKKRGCWNSILIILSDVNTGLSCFIGKVLLKYFLKVFHKIP